MPIPETGFEAARTLIRDKERILIIPHANVDPDGMSAALACSLLFTDLGKDCTVVCPDTPPQTLAFLPGIDTIERELSPKQNYVISLDGSRGFTVETLEHTMDGRTVNIIVTPKEGILTAEDVRFREGDPPFDLIVVVDTAELPLLGSLYETHRTLFERVPVLNIDHHRSNARFGTMQLIDSDAASATEVLYEWFSGDPDWKARITPDIATLLLTGLITDTRSFQNPNTTPRSLDVAAELLDLGARQQEVIRFIYKTKPLSTLKIWGRALNRMQFDPKSRIVWSLVSREDLAEVGAQSRETHGIIDELLTTIPDADVSVLFTEVEEGGFKASMRSSERVDASALTGKLFGGGGHARAAGFRMQNYDNFQLAALECVQRIAREIGGGGREEIGEIREIEDTGNGTIDIVEKLSE